jgi:nucleotide-binding universal stress UspA family protein
MMLKTLLVPLTGNAAEAAALRLAFRLAKAFDVHVDALLVKPNLRHAVPLLGAEVSATLIDEILTAAEEEAARTAAQARAAFDAEREAAGAPQADRPLADAAYSARWIEITGQPEERVPLAARLADLVVFGANARDPGARTYASLEATLVGSGRPLLLAPAQVPAEVGRTIAIAWNGSLQGARAVAGALPLLARAEQVHVLTAPTPATQTSRAQELVDYLAWQGIGASAVPVTVKGEPVGAALLRAASSVRADVLVTGGYGHSRLREMILGGVTRHLWGHAGLPVLMAH